MVAVKNIAQICQFSGFQTGSYVLHPYCLYGCPRFRRTEIEMGGDLTAIVLVNIQTKCIVEYL